MSRISGAYTLLTQEMNKSFVSTGRDYDVAIDQ